MKFAVVNHDNPDELLNSDDASTSSSKPSSEGTFPEEDARESRKTRGMTSGSFYY